MPEAIPEVAVEVPTSVREALGDKAALDMVPWLMRLIPVIAVSRDEFREVLSRLDKVEDRLYNLEAEVKELRREMRGEIQGLRGEFSGEIQGLRKEIYEEIQALRREMNERFDQMYERMLVQTRWLIGSIAVIGTVISILLAVGQFVR